MPFKQKMESGEWAKFLGTLKKKDLLGTISYQRILELSAEALRARAKIISHFAAGSQV
jgi:hypothetical protein